MERKKQQHPGQQHASTYTFSQALVPLGGGPAFAPHKRSSCCSSLGSEEGRETEATAAAMAEAAEAAAAEEEPAAEAAEAAAVTGIPTNALALFPCGRPAGGRRRSEGGFAAEGAAAAGGRDQFHTDASPSVPRGGHQQQRILLALPDDYTASRLPLTCDYRHITSTTTTPSPFASSASTPALAAPLLPILRPASSAAPCHPLSPLLDDTASPTSSNASAALAASEEHTDAAQRAFAGNSHDRPLLSHDSDNVLRNDYQVVLYKNRHIVLYNPHTNRAGARSLSAAEERAINVHCLAQCPLCGQAVDSHQFSFEARTYFQILQQLYRRLRRQQQRRCSAASSSASAARFAAPSSSFSAAGGEEREAYCPAAASASPDAAARTLFTMHTARRVAAAAGPPSLPSAAAAALPPVLQQQQEGSGVAGVAAAKAESADTTPATEIGTAAAVLPSLSVRRFGGEAAGSHEAWPGKGRFSNSSTSTEQPPQEQPSLAAAAAAQQQQSLGRVFSARQQRWQQQQQQKLCRIGPAHASAALLNEAFQFTSSSNSSRDRSSAAASAVPTAPEQQTEEEAWPFSQSSASVAAAASSRRANAPAAAAPHTGTTAECIPSTRNIPVELLVTGYYRRFFVEREKLGSGSYGQVYLCTHILDELTLGEYAVKKLPVGDDKHWLQKMLQEVKIREKLHHPNIVDYKHSWLEMHRSNQMCPWVPWLFVLMEYCNGGSLETLIWDRGIEMPPSRFLSDDQVWLLLLDMLLGLQHLHQSAILYRDMKPSNVLLQHLEQRLTGQLQCRALLADFGTAELLGEQQRSREAGEEEREKSRRSAADQQASSPTPIRHYGYTGTIEFTAPEVLQTDNRCSLYGTEGDTKSDMWSLGIILYAMCYAHLPYFDKEPAACRRLILAHETLQLPAHPPRHPTLKLLIEALTSKDAALRPSTDEVLEDPRVREVLNDRPRLERAGEDLALLLQQRMQQKAAEAFHLQTSCRGNQSRRAAGESTRAHAARTRRKVSHSRESGIGRRSLMASLPPIHPPAAEAEDTVPRFSPPEGAVALSGRDAATLMSTNLRLL